MDKDEMRRRLEAIVRKTGGAINLTDVGWWDGDAAGKRRALDELKAGRLAWATAQRHAVSGIAKLDEGDLGAAELYTWSANDLYIDALEAQLSKVRPRARDALNRPAGRRGRPAGSPNVKGKTK